MSKTEQDKKKATTIEDLMAADNSLQLKPNEAELVILIQGQRMHMKVNGDNLILAAGITTAMRTDIKLAALLAVTVKKFVDAMKSRGVMQELAELTYHTKAVNEYIGKTMEQLHNEGLHLADTLPRKQQQEQHTVAEGQSDKQQSQKGGEQ